MRPTVEDLQAIWLFTYSRGSLLDAANFLAELGKVTPESFQYRALVDAAVTAYTRPLTTCSATQTKDRPLKNVPPPNPTSASMNLIGNSIKTFMYFHDISFW